MRVVQCRVSRYDIRMLPKSPNEILKKAKTSALLVSNLINIRYLTGLRLSAGLLLIKPRSITLFVDGRYKEVSEQEARKGIKVQDIEKIERVFKSVKECGFESDNVTVSRLKQWKKKFKNTKFIQTSGVIEAFRRSKGSDEIKAFRRAQRITHELMRRIPLALKSKVTERGLAFKLINWAQELGADEHSFDPIVAFGKHSSHPHHKPTDAKLKKGDIVQIDTGVRFDGYCADQSKVFFTGEKTSEQGKVLDAVAAAKSEATAEIASGISTHALDRIARKILKEHGFEKFFPHSLGHGLGLEVHEGITLSQKVDSKDLLMHEIITIEPGVYLPGKFGIRLEDEIIVLGK